MDRFKTPKSRIRKLRTFSLGEKPYEFKYSKNNINKNLIDLSSNDYFGLSRDPEVIKAAHQISLSEGLGSGSSRFISGSRPIHKQLENKLGKWLNKDSVLLFPSGFQANIAAIQALADKNTFIIADKLIHNSLLIGARASGAKLIRFRHNDSKDLQSKLSKYSTDKNSILVVVESLYSMEGSTAPLEKITQLCQQYRCKLLVDEAHSLGILGPQGKGLSFQFNNSINIVSGTFGKAFGSGGAFLACNQIMGENLIQTSSPFRYTTALSPSLAAGALKSLQIIEENQTMGANLLRISKLWKKEINKLEKFEIIGDSHILSIIIGNDEKTMMMQKYLEDKGYLAIGIRPPTVPVGKSRIRLTIRNSLNNIILQNFISALKAFK
tara:strand:+ start:927 stop:2069 length:1143 start_codon:yes stop_codon:yes gene_type:complete